MKGCIARKRARQNKTFFFKKKMEIKINIYGRNKRGKKKEKNSKLLSGYDVIQKFLGSLLKDILLFFQWGRKNENERILLSSILRNRKKI